MKLQAGFCPNEARTLLSLCTNSNTVNPRIQTNYDNARKHCECFANVSRSNSKLKLEIGKCATGAYYFLFRADDYTVHNIQKDLEVNLSDAAAFAQHPNARVQKSFLELFEAFIPEIRGWIETICCNSPLDLYIAGHGKAATAATLCAAWLKQQVYAQPIRMKVYLFGSPRVGNTFFADELNEAHGARNWCFNVRHSQDLIPFIPLAPCTNPRQPMPVYSFKDVGNLVLLKGEMTLHGTTLTGTFSKHRAPWYAHYLEQEFQSTKCLGFRDP